MMSAADMGLHQRNACSCCESTNETQDIRERGKSLRKLTPRGSHATWRAQRQIDALTSLEESSAGRIASLVPIRYGRMLESPSAFLRGCPLMMARDLRETPRTGIEVQACGDAHLLNFGLFASPERHLLFDVNDFDETLAGPWEWDVKRLAASLVIVGREQGAKEEACREYARACVSSYRGNIDKYSQMRLLDVWYSRVEGKMVLKVFHQKGRDQIAAEMKHARHSDQQQAVAKLSTDDAEDLHFEEDPPVIVHDHRELSQAQLRRILSSYRETLQENRRHLFDGYKLADVVLKVVGLGSVGTRCFAALLVSDRNDDCVILQIKEATPSVFESLAGPAWNGNQGKRTVIGQRLIQGFTDIFLGWGSDGQRDYYIRQLHDMKGYLDPANSSSRQLKDYAKLCGWVLARAHARSGNVPLIAGYLGKSDTFDDSVATFAIQYADQNERDFESFRKAVEQGRFPVERGI